MKTKLLVILVVALTLLVPTCPVWADSLTAQELQSLCESESQKALCIGYISGVTDTFLFINESRIKDSLKPIICPPISGFKYGAAVHIVSTFIILHPELSYENASKIAGEALLLAFPCAPQQ